MFRKIGIICRQINLIPKTNQYYCGLWRKYHDVGKSFASNVNHPLDVLELIPHEPNALSSKDISGIFYDLQRTHAQNPCELKAIENHRNFSILCESTKENLASVQTKSSTNLVAILKTVQGLGMSVKHDLTQSILCAILHQVSALTLDDIFTLDQLVRESYNKRRPNALHLKLQLILPMVYQINYLDRLDYEDVNKLCSSLNFIANNFERISRRSVSSVVTSLRMSGSNITQKHAIRIMSSLSKLKYINAHIEPLLKKCIQVVSDASLAPDEIKTLLICLNQFDISKDRFNEEFWEKCVSRVIQDDCDVALACFIHRKFSELKFTSVELLEFICMKLSNDSNSLSLYETLGLIMDLSNTNHKPSNWEEVILPMIENKQLSKLVKKHKKTDWPRIATSLIQLGHYDTALIDQIMDNDSRSTFQETYPDSLKDLVAKLREESFVTLEKMLSESLGESKVLSCVMTQHDCSIKCVLKINQQTGQFVTFADHERENKNLSLDEIHCEADELLIGIISKSLPGWLRTKMLSLDMVMVPITLHKWAAMPEYMKMTEIFNSITIRIQIYKNKVKTLPRDGHRIK